MLKLRTDVAYVSPTGRMTQAGVEAIQGQLDEGMASVAALETRVTAVETTLAGSLIKLQTSVAASGQTIIDFTGVPSWVNRITVIFAGLSTNGTSNVLVQIGDSGGIENTGYLSTQGAMDGGAVGTTSATNGFHLTPSEATNVISGAITLSRQTGNTWVASGLVKRSATAVLFPSGDKTLSATLDRLRLTMANGTDTFDAGSVSISWE